MGILKKLFQNNHVEINNKEDKSNENQLNKETPVLENKVFKEILKNKGKENQTIEESCDQVLDAMRQLEELKLEYHAVTSYLTDIQKIDGILVEEREALNDIARKIITATREKAKIQTTGKRLSDSAYKTIATYEDDLPKELKRMQDNEIYQSKINNDMKHLEGEKTSLFLQKEDLEERQIYLKKVGILTSIFIVVLFGLFAIIENGLDANMKIPFLLTVTMGLVVATYIFIQATGNQKENKLIEAKLNKAITLLNKVKIKYINNTNALDYSYQKYKVRSYNELLYLWEQYNKAIEDEKKYNKNSELLDNENKELIKILKRYQLDDPGIWIYQAVALIDSKEMVEVRHHLNVRRQKLRDSMDYNNKLKEENIDRIRDYLNKLPAEKVKYEPLLKKYGIYL
jgi:hypothetical protein